jgi:hypothetical protein
MPHSGLRVLQLPIANRLHFSHAGVSHSTPLTWHELLTNCSATWCQWNVLGQWLHCTCDTSGACKQYCRLRRLCDTCSDGKIHAVTILMAKKGFSGTCNILKPCLKMNYSLGQALACPTASRGSPVAAWPAHPIGLVHRAPGIGITRQVRVLVQCLGHCCGTCGLRLKEVSLAVACASTAKGTR